MRWKTSSRALSENAVLDKDRDPSTSPTTTASTESTGSTPSTDSSTSSRSNSTDSNHPEHKDYFEGMQSPEHTNQIQADESEDIEEILARRHQSRKDAAAGHLVRMKEAGGPVGSGAAAAVRSCPVIRDMRMLSLSEEAQRSLSRVKWRKSPQVCSETSSGKQRGLHSQSASGLSC